MKLSFGWTVLGLALVCAQAHADSCDFASLNRGADAQSAIVQMVRTALNDALASRAIPVDTAKIDLQSENGCYRDGNMNEYTIRVQARITTARGNVLEISPLVFSSYGGHEYPRYDNEGAKISDGYVLEFDLQPDYVNLDQGGGQAVGPSLTNVATQANVVDDMRSISSFQSKIVLGNTL